MKTSIDQLPTMLIVDDEIALRMLLKEYFKKRFDVTVAENGLACLAALKQSPLPSVIVLDMVMPDLSGLEVIAEIKRQKVWDKIAIIVLSAKESSVDRIAAIKMGADDFLVKPFNPEELEVRIHAILRRIQKAQ